MRVPNGNTTAQRGRWRILATIQIGSFVVETSEMLLLPALPPPDTHQQIGAGKEMRRSP